MQKNLQTVQLVRNLCRNFCKYVLFAHFLQTILHIFLQIDMEFVQEIAVVGLFAFPVIFGENSTMQYGDFL